MKTNLMLLLALTASSLTAADIVWNPSVSSGAYNDGASWTGGVAPTAEDTPTFRQSGTVDVSAKADGAFQSLKVIASGGDLSVNLNPSPFSLLGSRELLVAGASTACATLNVTGGVVANMLRVRLGDSAPNGTLCVTGDGTKMAASGDNTIVGFHHPNCALEVLGGARFTSGRETILGYAVTATNNEVRVAGAGSVYEDRPTGDFTRIGLRASFNRLIVEDGGLWTNASARTTIMAEEASASNNLFLVRNGGRAHLARFVVGVAGSNNRVSVEEGGSLCATDETVIGETFGSFNTFSVGEGVRVDFRKVKIGYGNGSCSNLLLISSGAMVTNGQPFVVGTSAIIDPASAVGNGIVVSNAVVYGSMDETGSEEVTINAYGTGGYLKVVDGGKFYANQSFSVGGSVNVKDIFSDCSHGLIEVSGPGSLIQSLRYHFAIGRFGHDNTLRIADGGQYIVPGEMIVGSEHVGSTNNLLHIRNGSLTNDTPKTLCLYNNSRIRWEGSRSSIRVSSLASFQKGELEFVFDEDGIAPFGPVYETFLIDADHQPTVGKIRIDATKYVRNPGSRTKTFTLLRSERDRQCRVVGTDANLPSEDFAAINERIRNLIECEPAGLVTVTKVDMQHSRIEVKVQKSGPIIVIR